MPWRMIVRVLRITATWLVLALTVAVLLPAAALAKMGHRSWSMTLGRSSSDVAQGIHLDWGAGHPLLAFSAVHCRRPAPAEHDIEALCEASWMQDFEGRFEATKGEEILVGLVPGKGDWFLLSGREASLTCVLARGWKSCGRRIDWGLQYHCKKTRCDRRELFGEASRVPAGEQDVPFEESPPPAPPVIPAQLAQQKAHGKEKK